MTLDELKQAAIDNYVNLMRIKSEEKAENKELDRQLKAECLFYSNREHK